MKLKLKMTMEILTAIKKMFDFSNYSKIRINRNTMITETN